MSEKTSKLTVNVCVTDMEIFKGLLDLFVELSHQLNDEQTRYFIDKVNELLGEEFFEIQYEKESE